jgi:hypothetical protein
MFIAAMHNSVSRLYETFGNGGADTVERTLQPEEFSRTWFRQNPPLAKALWSQRNNNNYEQTGLLTSLHYFSENSKLFLKNFYLKSKRSVTKPAIEGPAAYVLPGDESRVGAQAALLAVLRKQGCEISRATAPFSVTMPAKKPKRTTTQDSQSTDSSSSESQDRNAASRDSKEKDSKPKEPPAPTTLPFPAGSYIIRMDQPYSRIADALLDYQYWSPNDPQKTPYDDTGWTFGELFNVRVVRVNDPKVLATPMERAPEKLSGSVSGSGSVFVLNNNADTALASLRYRIKDASIDAAEEPFEAAGHRFNRGSFIIKNVDAAAFQHEVSDLGLHAFGLASAPSTKAHPVRAARIAFVHTWLSTQTEGWWRLALDNLKIPFDYISTQEVARNDALKAKYDVILFPPVGRFTDPVAIINGLPTDWGNPLPWKTTPETPNLGKNDSTDDMRPGLTWVGVAHLQDFVKQGGVLLTVQDTSNLAVSLGLTHGVAIERPKQMKIVGSVVRARLVDSGSPIAYGYADNLSIYCDNGPIFNLSNLTGGRGFRRLGPEQGARPTGRGTLDDPDFTPGRAGFEAPDEPHAEPWQAQAVTDEQRRNGINVIPPASRPRVVFRYADTKDLLVSGLVDNGNEIAQHATVIDVPVEAGHVILFSNNPIYRGETVGSYSLVLNIILNFDSLSAGRKLDDK